jgi:hypothetical protein
VNLASRGQRDLDSGPEAIGDSAELAAIKAQARKVYLESFAAALVATLVAIALPR